MKGSINLPAEDFLLLTVDSYRAMMENDRGRIQGALDRINHMTGIEAVNMYDQDNELAYTSLPDDSLSRHDPDCKSCHRDFGSMFSETEKSYRIIDGKSVCVMNPVGGDHRILLIKSPILNQE